MYFIYNFILTLLYILFFPYLIYKLILHYDEWRQRLGKFNEDDFKDVANQKPIWIHSASVGEVVAVTPIVKKLKEKYPEQKIIFSTTSVAGQSKAQQMIKDYVSVIFIMPLDFYWNIKKIIKIVKPKSLLLVETELWPNLINEFSKAGLKIALINGRISTVKLPNYKRFNWAFKPILDKFSIFCMQSEDDLERIVSIGASKDKTFVTGITKYDTVQIDIENIDRNEIRNSLKIPNDDFVVVFGSVRENEEEKIIYSINRIKSTLSQKELEKIVFIIAPRHLNRLTNIEDLCEKKGIPYCRKTKIDCARGGEEVVLLDTMGELGKLYVIANVAFIGGSLAPYGGHNPLEPASVGVPVIFGPYMENCRESADALIINGGAIEVQDSNELVLEIIRLFKNPHEAIRRGEVALKTIEENRGASEKTIKLLSEYGVI